jgi:hypothetical protein
LDQERIDCPAVQAGARWKQRGERLVHGVAIQGDAPFGFDFEEFADAKTFAAAAQKSLEITKVGIKNNESPQYLTVWEKS